MTTRMGRKPEIRNPNDESSPNDEYPNDCFVIWSFGFDSSLRPLKNSLHQLPGSAKNVGITHGGF